MRIKIINQVPSAKPPRRIPNLLVHRLKFKRLRKFISNLNPKLKEMQSQVLELTYDPKVQLRIEETNLKKWFKKVRKFSDKISKSDDEKLLVLACELLGTEFGGALKKVLVDELNHLKNIGNPEQSPEKYIQELFRVIQKKCWRKTEQTGRSEIAKKFINLSKYSSPEQAEKFTDDLDKVVEHKNWGKLGENGQAELIEYLGNGYYGDYKDLHDKKETAVYELLEIISDKGWTEIGKIGKGKLVGFFMWYYDPKNQEKAKKALRSLFKLTKSKEWKKLNAPAKEKAVKEFEVLLKNSIQNAEKYVLSVLKILENGIKVEDEEDFEIKNLLRKIVVKHSWDSFDGKIGSLEQIQEIVRDLALINSDDFLENCRRIFDLIRRPQFDSLCALLAKENPELVQRLGEEIFERRWS